MVAWCQRVFLLMRDIPRLKLSFEVVITHDSFAVGLEFTASREQWRSLDGAFNVALLIVGCVSIHKNFDVITHSSDGDCWDVWIVPFIVGLVEEFLKVKVE